MAAPISTALPEAPSASDSPSVFEEKSFAFVGALEPFRVDLQAQADFVNDNVGPGSDAEAVANIAADVSTVAAVAPDVSLLAVGQVSKTELAADGGSWLVGFEYGESGEIASTVKAMLSKGAIKVSNFVTGTGDEAAGLLNAINAADGGALDLEGMTINASSVSAVLTGSLAIISTKPGASLTMTGAADNEYFIQLTTVAGADIVLNNFKVDSANLAAKGVNVTNTANGRLFYSENFESINCTQTAATGLAAGLNIYGGFDRVVIKEPVIKSITSTGGSLVSSGIRTGQNGTAVCKKITVLNPEIEDISPGNDGDGLALLQAFPFTENGDYHVIGGRFKNCHKRAIKTQCYKTIVSQPTIIRGVTHVVSAGNIDIDIQYGNGVIVNPVFDYLDDTTFPAGGLVSLNGQRGITTDRSGIATKLIGGVCSIETISTAPNNLFNTSTYHADDKVNAPSVDGFVYDGEVDHVWNIRPLASAAFNDVVVFDPVLNNVRINAVNSEVFEIDRSGTGYAFVENACVTSLVNKSEAVQLAQLVTTNVGVTYDILNDNVGVSYARTTHNSTESVATGTAFTKDFTCPLNSTLEITLSYVSGAGTTYHAFRKSILTLGDESSEKVETNLNNLGGLGGSLSMSAALSGSTWTVTVSKGAGSGAVAGVFGMSIVCPSKVNEV